MFKQLLETHGFALVQELLSEQACEEIALQTLPSTSLSGGTRSLIQEFWCELLAIKIREHSLMKPLIPSSYGAVQCNYFEKPQSRNWLVPLHQDLSIPVAERIDHSELNGWSYKEGVLFVQAPMKVLNQLIVVRLHIDDCGAQDGPLRVVPGSHHYGRIHDKGISEVRRSNGEVVCRAGSGDALVLRPLLLHASSKSSGESRRRVLHFVYGPGELPFGLKWQHIV
jgi:Phytanoyl-CoA dioxygenase (PhyH)